MTRTPNRDRGRLFDNRDKRKPSQPDMRGDCTIAGVSYEMTAWMRDDQLAVSITPVNRDGNTRLPDAFRGALDAVRDRDPHLKWAGQVVGDSSTYSVHASEVQGKSGAYLTLTFDVG